jgi:hypothetical protein
VFPCRKAIVNLLMLVVVGELKPVISRIESISSVFAKSDRDLLHCELSPLLVVLLARPSCLDLPSKLEIDS